mmetsp:Transcript_90273/g.150926  ORF Transcript_90273/g.150926 Transcript_90273/m.150926 type:complete len:275 (-) Transcript_90273:78-902(-)
MEVCQPPLPHAVGRTQGQPWQGWQAAEQRWERPTTGAVPDEQRLKQAVAAEMTHNAALEGRSKTSSLSFRGFVQELQGREQWHRGFDTVFSMQARSQPVGTAANPPRRQSSPTSCGSPANRLRAPGTARPGDWTCACCGRFSLAHGTSSAGSRHSGSWAANPPHALRRGSWTCMSRGSTRSPSAHTCPPCPAAHAAAQSLSPARLPAPQPSPSPPAPRASSAWAQRGRATGAWGSRCAPTQGALRQRSSAKWSTAARWVSPRRHHRRGTGASGG